MTDNWIQICSQKIRTILYRIDADFLLRRTEEVRLRTGQPLALVTAFGLCYAAPSGQLTLDWHKAYLVSEDDVKETLSYVSDYSPYAYKEEICQGFVTISGGHRIGLAGQWLTENGRISALRHISSINIRLAHERKGCAEPVLPYLFEEDHFCHTLILSPPRLGKTTLLRDCIRLLSNGSCGHAPMSVGVADERLEISASYHGIPQMDLGRHSDVISGIPKADAMRMLLRTMAPDIIAADELGAPEELDALAYIIRSGCCILTTVHSISFEALQDKPVLYQLVETNIFERIITLYLDAEGKVMVRIEDSDHQLLWEGRRCNC